jgi:hypothetical protein
MTVFARGEREQTKAEGKVQEQRQERCGWSISYDPPIAKYAMDGAPGGKMMIAAYEKKARG